MRDQVFVMQRETVSGDAVDHDDARVALLDLIPHHQREFVGGEAERLHMHDGKHLFGDQLAHRDSDRTRSGG